MEISVDDLKPKSILAKNVVNFNGQLLLQNGVEITEKHLALLKKWGIDSVHIKTTDKIETPVTFTHSISLEHSEFLIPPENSRMLQIMKTIFYEHQKLTLDEPRK